MPAAENQTAKARVVVTGHNRESAGRVTHYIRRVSGEGAIEFHAGALITDEEGIIADNTEFDLKISLTSVRK